MANVQHYAMTTANLHVACYTVADAAARSALAGALISADRGKLLLQLDEGTVWQCTAAGEVVHIGQNSYGEGYSVDADGTATIKLGDAAGVQKFRVVDNNDNVILEMDSAGVSNIVCHDDEVVCFDDEVVLS